MLVFFSNKTGEKFNLTKIFGNAKIQRENHVWRNSCFWDYNQKSRKFKLKDSFEDNILRSNLCIHIITYCVKSKHYHN